MSKPSVLVVGNGISDVYINLDARANQFEFDEQGAPWLDIGFAENAYTYFQQTPVLGGAATTLDVLQALGIDARFAGEEIKLDGGCIRRRPEAQLSTRFILCRNRQVAYVVPRERKVATWQAPQEQIDWLLVDRSVELSEALVAQIERYLDLSSQTRLAVHVGHCARPLTYQLAQRADLVFIEQEAARQKLPAEVQICQIAPETIRFGAAQVYWHPEKAGFLTHLTTYSVLAATFLAAYLQGDAPELALNKAKLNAEQTRLDGALSATELQQALDEQAADRVNLREIAACMVAPGKGILAADESGGSIDRHFADFDIPDDEQHRRDYRNLLLSLPDLNQYVNAVILFDETTHQLADNGQNFVEFLTGRGIIPGVKVDQGLENLPNSTEQFTRGLDGLPERMRAYYQQGLRFAKWRSLFVIDQEQGTPSDVAIERVCADLAQYARICQEAGIVPIVEPEVLHKGRHSLAEAATAQRRVLNGLFQQLAQAEVDLAGCILKCSMVLAGSEAEQQSTPEEVGVATSEVLRECVPAELAGVVFLSGGQSVERATQNLRAVLACGPFPWPVTFSFARALQWPALETWRGNNANVAAAQAAYRDRLIANCQALQG